MSPTSESEQVSLNIHYSTGCYVQEALILHQHFCYKVKASTGQQMYEARTESHEQRFFACELGTADEGECGDRWNQLLCYP